MSIQYLIIADGKICLLEKFYLFQSELKLDSSSGPNWPSGATIHVFQGKLARGKFQETSFLMLCLVLSHPYAAAP